MEARWAFDSSSSYLEYYGLFYSIPPMTCTCSLLVHASVICRLVLCTRLCYVSITNTRRSVAHKMLIDGRSRVKVSKRLHILILIVFDLRAVPGGSSSRGLSEHPEPRVNLHVQKGQERFVVRQRRTLAQTLIPAARSKPAGPLEV
jgi:hypothetical protein